MKGDEYKRNKTNWEFGEEETSVRKKQENLRNRIELSQERVEKMVI